MNSELSINCIGRAIVTYASDMEYEAAFEEFATDGISCGINSAANEINFEPKTLNLKH